MRIVDVNDSIIKNLRNSGISKLMKSLESCDWLAIEENNDRIIGAAGMGGFFHVSSIQIIEEFQNKGIGKKLQKELIDESRRRGYSFVMVLFNPSNIPSANLHTSLGYKKIFRIKYSENYINDVNIIIFRGVGNFLHSILKIFNSKTGMFFLACCLKILKPLFRRLIAYDENDLPSPSVRWIVRNFEKIN